MSLLSAWMGQAIFYQLDLLGGQLESKTVQSPSLPVLLKHDALSSRRGNISEESGPRTNGPLDTDLPRTRLFGAARRPVDAGELRTLRGLEFTLPPAEVQSPRMHGGLYLPPIPPALLSSHH